VASRIFARASAFAAAARALIGIEPRIAAPAGPIGDFLNHPLAAAEQNGFFRWFHLAETRREPAVNGDQKIVYQPTGEKFHDLAMVIVTVNASALINRMELMLKRSFIASPRNGIFASDIAKSFVLASLPEDGAAELRTLANEIAHRARSSQPVIVGPGYSSPKLPERFSRAYEVYAGVRPSHAAKLVHYRFEIGNQRTADSEQLSISFTIR
jgi:hypothetical protein